MLENCKSCKVILTHVLATVEIINSKSCQVIVKEFLPQCQVEKSESTNVYLYPGAKSCIFHSTCTQSLILHYPKAGAGDDDEWVDVPIPETYVTTIGPNDLL